MVYIILHPRSWTWTLKSNHRKVIFQPSLFRVCAMRTLGFKWITFSCRIPPTNHGLNRCKSTTSTPTTWLEVFFEQTEIRFIQFKIRHTIQDPKVDSTVIYYVSIYYHLSTFKPQGSDINHSKISKLHLYTKHIFYFYRIHIWYVSKPTRMVNCVLGKCR